MLYAIVAALVLIADQLLKYWTTLNLAVGAEKALIPGVIHLTNIHNTGSAFSFLEGWAGARWMFLALTVLFLVLVVMGFVKNIIRRPFGRWMAALVTAGAVGNAIDRALYGFVVDMFEPEFINFAVFNIADIFITCGGISFCLHVIFCKDSLVFEKVGVDTSDIRFDDELAPRPAPASKKRAAEPRRQVSPAAPEKASKPQPSSAAAPSAKTSPRPADSIPVFDPSNPFAEWENRKRGSSPAPAPEAASAPVVPKAKAVSEPESVPEPKPEPEPEPKPEPESKPQPEPTSTAVSDSGTESFSLDDILAEFSDRQ